MRKIYKNGDYIGPNKVLLLKRLENRKGIFRCNYCGEKHEAYINNVVKGYNSSCGCQNKYYKSGDKIGPKNILLIKYLYKDKNRKWHCLFECPFCGSEFEAVISAVVKGNTTSCGCYRKNITMKNLHESNAVDLAGKRSGDWTFIKRLNKQSKNKT